MSEHRRSGSESREDLVAQVDVVAETLEAELIDAARELGQHPPDTSTREGIGARRGARPMVEKLVPYQPSTGAMAIRMAFERAYGGSGVNPTQVFSLVWPGTKLDYGRFHWHEGTPDNPNPVYPPVTDIVTSLLLDEWYPPTLITQPDGSSTAARYRQALGALAPKTNVALATLQNRVREALQQEVYYQPHADGAPQPGRWITLADLFDLLYGEWIAAKREWGEVQFKQMEALGLIGVDQTDVNYMDEWNSYTAWYELVADGYLAKIDEKYNQILVYFPLNEWNDCLALLDTTDAPQLEEAKQEMRDLETAIPHQFGVEYYPTTAQPYDFGNFLVPTTTFIDLLADPQFVGASLNNNLQGFLDQLASLKQSCSFLSANLKQKLAQDEKAYDAALDAHQKAQLDLENAYVDSTVTAVKAVIAYETGGFGDGNDGGNKAPSTQERQQLLNKLADTSAQQWKRTVDIEAALTSSIWKISAGDEKGILNAAFQTTPTPPQIADANSRAGVPCSTFVKPAQDVYVAVPGGQGNTPTADTTTVKYNAKPSTTTWLATTSATAPVPRTPTDLAFSNAEGVAFYQLVQSDGTFVYSSVKASQLEAVNADALDKLVDEVAQGMKAINGGTSNLLSTGIKLATTAGQLAQDSNDAQVQQIILPLVSQVQAAADALQRKIAEFTASSAKDAGSSAGANAFPVALTSPDPFDPSKSVPCDLWDAVQLSVSISSMQQQQEQVTSSSQYSWGVNLFLASAGGEGQSSAASFMSEAANSNSDIEIGMLCMKVDIDRPWMHPEIFTMTEDLYRSVPQPVTNNGGPHGPLTFEQLFGKPGDPDFDKLSNQAYPCSPTMVPNLLDSPFPSYPVSLLIAKDVSIRIKTNAGSTSVARAAQSSVQSAGGGFLCFTASTSSSSQSSSSSASSFCTADTQVFRSPAPQIIGVWSQLTPPDRSVVLSEQAVENVLAALAQIASAQTANRTASRKEGLPVLGATSGSAT